MMDEKLMNAINSYKQNPDDYGKREAAIRKLGENLYGGLRRFKLDYLTEDSRSDFFVYLYPRLGRIIDQFDRERSSFNTYVTWVVRLSWRTFWRNHYNAEARQRVLETEEFTNLLSREAETANEDQWSSYTADASESFGDASCPKREKGRSVSAKRKEMESRKIFLLACKAGNFLDESAVAKLAGHTGYNEAYIRKTLETIRERCGAKRERMRAFRELQNACYIRAQKCLFEMKYLDRDTGRYFALEKEYRYCVERLAKLRAKASRQIRSPSNRFLASTLGISRGTIDSTLASALQHEYSDKT